MKELRSQIEIESPAERVWQVLTDFAAYPEWNPFIRRVDGQPEVEEQLVVRMRPSGTRGMTFRPTVMKAEPNRQLRWLGHLLVPGLFDGEHIFEIEELGFGRVLFIQREVFKGLLVPLLARSLDKDTQRGFEEMNRALRERAETADQVNDGR
ncbi:MAG: SRPBCC domain-containing protein [Rubrobacteraceae bacterium]|nr:SRPBCC domain-containing protein [Rubrobacteraceae bacterium]